MNKKYNIRVTQLTTATKNNLLELAQRAILNNDILEIVISTNAVAGTLKEIKDELVLNHGVQKVRDHVRIKVPFGYRSIKEEILKSWGF